MSRCPSERHPNPAAEALSSERTLADPQLYDAIVVGAGICGVIFLRYAREQGLNCLVLEKQDDVGGLWNQLPSWQDIQNRRQDFAINDVPLDGATQPAIHEHVKEWVRRYDLERSIELECEVTSVSRQEHEWRVRTDRGDYRARYVIAASGVQNEPWVPDVERSSPAVEEIHSARLWHPERLKGRRVTVVGGGTSSWDLLDLAIQHGAEDIHWVHRGIRWFMPTSRSKQESWPNLRELALAQVTRRSTEKVNRFLRWLLRKKFDRHGVTEIEPEEPFDVRKHQLIPGRVVMLRNLDRIHRHHGEVRLIQGHQLTLDSGDRLETDVILWGTGYRMNLEYLGLPEYDHVKSLDELRPRLGSLVRSMDHPDLFFLGMTLIDSTSSTPFFAAIESKSIVAHIRGRCEIPRQPMPHAVTHWDLFGYFAEFDHANYSRFWWRTKYFLLAVWYRIFRDRTVRV